MSVSTSFADWKPLLIAVAIGTCIVSTAGAQELAPNAAPVPMNFQDAVIEEAVGETTDEAVTEDAVTDEAVEASRVTSGRFGYSFEVPEGWDQPAAPPRGVEFLILPEAEDDTEFNENLNVVSMRPTPEIQDLEVFLENLPNQLSGMMPEFNLIESEVVQLEGPGVSAGRVVYTATINGQAMQFVQYYLSSDRVTLVVTGTALPSSFASYEPAFRATVESLRFDDESAG